MAIMLGSMVDFVLEPSVLDLIEGDGTVWETDVLPRLASSNRCAYQHRFGSLWIPYDRTGLRSWNSGSAPWKLW